MKAITTVAVGFLAGIAGAYVFNIVNEEKAEQDTQVFKNVFSPDPAQTFVESNPLNSTMAAVDFSEAAARATPSVVYINSIAQSGVSYTYWDMLFGGGGSHTQVSSGSGVIFSSDGY